MFAKKCFHFVLLSAISFLLFSSEVAAKVTPAHDLSPWGMYLAADNVVKSVMIGLVLASLATWTILIYKTIQLRRAKKHSEQLYSHLCECASFDHIDMRDQQSQVLRLVQVCHQEFALSLKGVVSESGLKERVNARLERTKANILAQSNQGTGLLATIGSVAPFIGLFGTVWGIMNSFIGIAESQTTNLAVVAPGIAEALLATAMGLIAAIPAVMTYNFFTRVINSYKAVLTDITSALMILLSRELDQTNESAKKLTLSILTTANENVANETHITEDRVPETVQEASI